MDDKFVERDRYDQRAATEIGLQTDKLIDGSESMSLYLKPPYVAYEKILVDSLSKNQSVLELGVGFGPFTGVLLHTGASICATDISQKSLEVLAIRHGGKGILDTRVADMEALPFSDNSFDVVTCAGSLSYGDNTIVMKEVFRVLKSDGIFVCVDSLNNNPIYRFNRWIHYLQGSRTKSTLLRMPTTELIDAYRSLFGHVEVRFFGSIIWCIPLFVRLFGELKSARFSDWFERFIGVRASAFKFVMVAKKMLTNY